MNSAIDLTDGSGNLNSHIDYSTHVYLMRQ
jgi:hypothetical protein